MFAHKLESTRGWYNFKHGNWMTSRGHRQLCTLYMWSYFGNSAR